MTVFQELLCFRDLLVSEDPVESTQTYELKALSIDQIFERPPEHTGINNR